MTIDSGSGLIEWTPTAAGLFDVTVAASNPEGTGQQSFSIEVIEGSNDPELIGHWTFDEGSGFEVLDMSENQNQGSVQGATWSSGKLAGALEFDGGSDRVLIGDQPSLDVSEPITLAAWVYRNGDQSGWRSVITREEGATPFEYYQLGFNNNGYNIIIHTDSGWRILDGPVAPNGVWVHLAATYDGSEVRLYVDGLVVAQDSHSGTFSADDTPIVIGAATNDFGSTYIEGFWGKIDDVRVYSRALGQQEIQELAMSQQGNQPPAVDAGPDLEVYLPDVASLVGSASDDGLPDGTLSYDWSKTSGPGDVTFGDSNQPSTTASFSASGDYVLELSVFDGEYISSDSVQITVHPEQQAEDVVAHWRLDEGIGTIISDSSGNANDGEVYGAQWASGKNGWALMFDGADDYVRVADSPSLDTTDALTVSAWVLKSGNQPGWVALVTREKGAGGSEHYYLGFSNNRFRWFVNTTNGYSQWDIGPQASNSEWTHVTGTYDGSDVRLYIDGAEVFSVSQSGVFSSDTTPVLIGGATNNGEVSYIEFFHGIIDEVRIYDRALSPAEVSALYNSFP
jgi:hypothetical protein